uniref:TIR domain-containing protein n=1 Tax=Magallana gigas TaxID=29159 RepID=A0A8W8P2X0_MAGGI
MAEAFLEFLCIPPPPSPDCESTLSTIGTKNESLKRPLSPTPESHGNCDTFSPVVSYSPALDSNCIVAFAPVTCNGDDNGRLSQTEDSILTTLRWIRDSKCIEFVGVNNYTCSLGNETAASFNKIGQIVQILEKKCSSYTLIIVLMTTLIIVSMTTTMSRILYRYRWKLRYMYYVAKEKYKSENHSCEEKDRSSFRFDAFISYADEERLFVFNLVKYLEEECNLRLCIHHRDFIPGTGIADNITNAIHCSRHTVCFMTSHFLQSHCLKSIHSIALCPIPSSIIPL